MAKAVSTRSYVILHTLQPSQCNAVFEMKSIIGNLGLVN